MKEIRNRIEIDPFSNELFSSSEQSSFFLQVTSFIRRSPMIAEECRQNMFFLDLSSFEQSGKVGLIS